MTRKVRSFIKDKALVAERRKHIAECATQLFVKQGYYKTSMREVLEACNMTSGTLYRYVGSREDIVRLIADFGSVSVLESLEALRKKLHNRCPLELLQESIEVFFRKADEIQDVLNFLNHAMLDLSKDDRRFMFDLEDRVIGFFEVLLRRAVESGEAKTDEVELLARNIYFLAHAWANRRKALRKLFTLEDYTRKQTEFILRSLGVDRGLALAMREERRQSSAMGVEAGEPRAERNIVRRPLTQGDTT